MTIQSYICPLNTYDGIYYRFSNASSVNQLTSKYREIIGVLLKTIEDLETSLVDSEYSIAAPSYIVAIRSNMTDIECEVNELSGSRYERVRRGYHKKLFELYLDYDCCAREVYRLLRIHEASI